MPTENDEQHAGSPRFIVDAMLGSLAKWLRILGYDADYASERDDDELAWIARSEGRTLLTRDVQLSRRRGVKALLVQRQELEAQLRQVIESLGLTLDNPFSRCPVCNAPLEEIGREKAAPLVPPFVLSTHSDFRSCPSCRKVFWRGTHWQKMRESLLKYRRDCATMVETTTQEERSGL